MQGKLKYCILQQLIEQYDFVCLTETKCDYICEDEIPTHSAFFMKKNNKSYRYGGIHGLCILVKKRLSKHCTIITDLTSDSILWLLIDKHVLGFSFVIAGVYLPNESSVHHHSSQRNI